MVADGSCGFVCSAKVASRICSPQDSSMYTNGSASAGGGDHAESVSSFATVGGSSSGGGSGMITLGVSVMNFEQHSILIRWATPAYMKHPFSEMRICS